MYKTTDEGSTYHYDGQNKRKGSVFLSTRDCLISDHGACIFHDNTMITLGENELRIVDLQGDRTERTRILKAEEIEDAEMIKFMLWKRVVITYDGGREIWLKYRDGAKARELVERLLRMKEYAKQFIE